MFAHRCLTWGMLILWMSLIFFLSAQPGLAAHGELTWRFLLERKGAHVFEYFILTILAWRVIQTSCDTLRMGWKFWMVSLFAFVYALSDECHQTFVYGREGKFSDVLIDGIGIMLAIGCIVGVKQSIRKRDA